MLRDQLHSLNSTATHSIFAEVKPRRHAAHSRPSINSLEDGESATVGNTPTPSLAMEQWDNADWSQFVVRGPTYKEDRVKIPATDPLFDLVAIDMWQVNAPIQNIASRPSNRVQQARARGDDSWYERMRVLLVILTYLLTGSA